MRAYECAGIALPQHAQLIYLRAVRTSVHYSATVVFAVYDAAHPTPTCRPKSMGASAATLVWELPLSNCMLDTLLGKGAMQSPTYHPRRRARAQTASASHERPLRHRHRAMLTTARIMLSNCLSGVKLNCVPLLQWEMFQCFRQRES